MGRCVWGRGLGWGGVVGGSKKRRKQWGWGSRLESTHVTRAADQRAATRKKVPVAKTQTYLRRVRSEGSTAGLRNAACNTSSLCVFVFLFVVCLEFCLFVFFLPILPY